MVVEDALIVTVPLLPSPRFAGHGNFCRQKDCIWPEGFAVACGVCQDCSLCHYNQYAIDREVRNFERECRSALHSILADWNISLCVANLFSPVSKLVWSFTHGHVAPRGGFH